jgi:hypothetical protein
MHHDEGLETLRRQSRALREHMLRHERIHVLRSHSLDARGTWRRARSWKAKQSPWPARQKPGPVRCGAQSSGMSRRVVCGDRIIIGDGRRPRRSSRPSTARRPVSIGLDRREGEVLIESVEVAFEWRAMPAWRLATLRAGVSRETAQACRKMPEPQECAEQSERFLREHTRAYALDVQSHALEQGEVPGASSRRTRSTGP